eukprot:TRINITY_DN26098_c0_g1_i1.p1 TRINITY_DN26098_c0_g1~~TRINITY_DN26098_c0_g1_i1.p1  ORF type:complete len:280 (-),score=52.45 TRINITY_DN26098_c0_g1_i1:34-873(-)
MKKSNQKISGILETLQRGEYQVALREVSNVLTKSKKKDALSEEEKENLKLLKAICSLRLFEYGEADSIFTEYITKHPIYEGEDEVASWLEILAIGLEKISDFRRFSDPFFKKNESNETILQRNYSLVIKEKNFKPANLLSFKLFNLSRKEDFKFFLAANVFNYLSLAQLPADQREKQLELCLKFNDKLLVDYNIDKAYQSSSKDNLTKQIAYFYAKVLRESRKFDACVHFIRKYKELFADFRKDLSYLQDITVVAQNKEFETIMSVSYTHLTLPTIYSV